MSSARLAVCIPAYNQPQFLAEALTSLCDQGLDREAYVVAVADDASPTSLAEVVDGFRSRLQIAYTRHPANLGHLANWDAAWQLADTPYIAFLSHDDVVAPGHLGRALAAIEAQPDVALVASLALYQSHPGSLTTTLQGCFLRGAGASFTRPYEWARDEWMGLALTATPMSIIGSVFQTAAFRRCRQWTGYPIWHDRLMLAEMGRHGRVISLPWIGGHYRTGQFQLSRALWQPDLTEYRQASQVVLEWCDHDGIPVREFWVDHICASGADDRILYLRMLHHSVDAATYRDIKRRCEERLQVRLHLGGRMNRLGVPAPVVALLQLAERLIDRRRSS
jgi:glycosyltransferase involved in cell wall biosynthesis